jgi:signal transduction histidine kinase
MDQYTLYLVFAPVAAGITFFLAVYTLRHTKENRGAQILTFYLLAVTGLVVCNVLELVTPTPQGTLFWAKVSYLFITTTPVIWFTFILHYTSHTLWLQKKRYPVLWVLPVITTLLAWSNDAHHLIWGEIAYRPIHQFLAMQVTHGLGFWLFAIFGYGLYIFGTVIVLREFLPSQRVYRIQSKWLLLGSVTPLAANLIYLFQIIPGLTKDYTPIVFATAGIFFAVAMFKHRLFDLTPVARAALIENMSDGVLVFDLQGRLVDINPAGEHMLTGQYILKNGERLIEHLAFDPAPSSVIHIPAQDGVRYYQKQRAPLTSDDRRPSGNLVVLRDVTQPTKDRQALERIRMELEERVAQRTAELSALNNSLEARVTMRTRFLGAVYAVLSLVSRAQDKETMLNQALLVVQEAVEADAGLVHLSGDADCLTLAAQHGLTPEEQTWAAADVCWKDLAARDEPWESAREPLPGFQPPFAIAAPIRVKEQRFGVLTLLCRTKPEWETADVHLVAAVAEQIGVGIEILRLHEQAKEIAVQQERARLARELHDSVMQLLYSQSLFVDAAQTSLDQSHAGQSSQYMGRVREIADQAVREMRLMIYQLRPAALVEGDLHQAVQTRLELVEQRAGMVVTFQYNVAVALPEAVETAVYRITEEALNNTLKHAHAKKVWVEITADQDAITASIRDDGNGFTPATVRPGLGLVSMRERAENLCGALEITSTPGQGSQVVARIPIPTQPKTKDKA